MGRHSRRGTGRMVTGLVTGVAVLLLVAGCAASPRQAQRYVERGRYDDAVRLAQQSLAVDPTNGEGWYWLGVAYHKRGESAKAIPSLEKALELLPATPSGRIARGQMYIRDVAYDMLGWAYLRTGKLDEALRTFSQALQALEGSSLQWEAHWGLGLALEHKGQYAEALPHLTEALTSNPSAVGPLIDRGWVFYSLGKFERAKADFEAASQQVQPTDRRSQITILRGRAFAYLGLGDGETAVKVIHQAQARAPDYYYADMDLASIYWARGNKAEAWKTRGGQGWIGVLADLIEDVPVIRGVTPGGPADHAGLLPGDRVRAVAGQVVGTGSEMMKKMAALVPGQPTTLTIEREGQERQVPVVPISADEGWQHLPQFIPILTKAVRPSPLVAAGPPLGSAGAPLGPPAAVDFGRYHALVIGNNRYRHVPPLETAVADAMAVAQVLREQYGFTVTLLTDATADQIRDALYQLRATLTEQDNALLYYAGHGVRDEAAERGYWLPVDAEGDKPTHWVSTVEVTDTLKAMTARHVLVVADSCYAGTLARGVGVSAPKTGEDPAAYVTRLAAKRSRTALLAGGLEPVLDRSGRTGHSVFAQAFLTALRENGGVLEGEGLFLGLRRAVVVNAPQTPEYVDIRFAGHEGGDFLFVRR